MWMWGIMNKYLVTVIVPVINLTFDVEIPNNRKIGTIKKILLAEVNSKASGMYNKSFNDIRVIDRDNGTEYSNDMYIKDSQIINGSKLILI